jgi:hypothetical protein
MAQRHQLFKGLFFVEGVGSLTVCGHPKVNDSIYPSYGENLRGVRCAPVRNPNQARNIMSYKIY